MELSLSTTRVTQDWRNPHSDQVRDPVEQKGPLHPYISDLCECICGIVSCYLCLYICVFVYLCLQVCDPVERKGHPIVHPACISRWRKDFPSHCPAVSLQSGSCGSVLKMANVLKARQRQAIWHLHLCDPQKAQTSRLLVGYSTNLWPNCPFKWNTGAN